MSLNSPLDSVPLSLSTPKRVNNDFFSFMSQWNEREAEKWEQMHEKSSQYFHSFKNQAKPDMIKFEIHGLYGSLHTLVL